MEQSHIQQVKVYSFWKDKKTYKDVFKIDNKIMSELDIFMPIVINTFDLEIAKKGKLLNIFEEAILKLAEIEIIQESLIHDAILLEEDLIKFIQGKLLEKNFLNQDKTISNNGINYLIQNNLSKKIYTEEHKAEIEIIKNKYKNEYECKIGHAFIGVNQELNPLMDFRNLQNIYITGNYQEDLEQEDANKKDKNIINFSMKIGSAGNAKNISGILNKYSEDYLFQNAQITQLDIKENFEKFFSKLHDLDNKINNEPVFNSYVGLENKAISFYNLEQLEKIKIIGKEKGYIHYKVIILDGDAENIVVSDGFSMYDPKLATYIKKNYSAILQYLNKIATKSKSISKNKKQKYNKNINDKYINIKINLKPIISNAQASINAPDKQKQIQLQNKKIVANYYIAIGWAIYYYIKNTKFDYNNSVLLNNFINLSSEDEKIKMLKELLYNINVNVTDYKKNKSHMLFELDSQKILNYQKNLDSNEGLNNNNLSIKFLLLLAVIEANQNKKNSSFYLFINNSEENQNKIFLSRIYQISRIRNKNYHGESNSKTKYNEKDLKKYNNYTYELVNYLLEDFYIDNLDNNGIDNSNNPSQEIVNAKNTLSNEFGILVHNQVFEKNKDYFIVLALLKINYSTGDDINITENINNMYNIFESILRLYVQNLLKLSKKEKIEVSKNEIIQNLSQNLIDFNISSELTSTRDTYFENACTGHNASLGAYLLLFINESLNNEVNKVELKKIINTICKIISYRGNGNSNINITISNSELLSLVDEVFNITKKIIKIIE